MKEDSQSLYFLVLILLAVVVTVALGGGLFNQQTPWYMQWQHKAFRLLCHQNPNRSFWINGQPMAVCSRCLGIYSGFALGWILLPIEGFYSFSESWPMKKVALAAVLINFLDIIGNILGFWENTLVSRLLLGSLMGSSAALIFSGYFFKETMKSIGNNHGRVTTADA